MGIAKVDSTTAASDVSPRPVWWWLPVAAAILAVGYSFGLWRLGVTAPSGKNDLLVVSSNWSAFAALFVLTLAVERLLQPISEWLGPSTSDAALKRDQKAATAKTDPTEANVKEAATGQDRLVRARAETTIITWAVATALAYAGCGALKILLLSAIVDTKLGGVPGRALDLLVTGLVVGAGTKPLHDLVANIQKTSSAKTDAPAKLS